MLIQRDVQVLPAGCPEHVFVVAEVRVIVDGERAAASHRHRLDGVLEPEVAQPLQDREGLLRPEAGEGGGAARVDQGRVPLVDGAALIIVHDAVHATGKPGRSVESYKIIWARGT